MQHKIDRTDLDPVRETSSLQEQIQRLRSQLRLASDQESEQLKEMIRIRTDRLKDVER